ncbi:MAG: TetR/AcrR family transcriptional regulator [Lachnospiraceae bacterium]|nr:TetR/AcrR family transcriptional regulator [Lachnospiraceae bacterium]
MKIRKRECKNLSTTQIMIVNSLLEIMKSDDYYKITISQIMDEAELARATFYNNYSSKDDVINSYIDELYLVFIEKAKETGQTTTYHMAFVYFEFWKQYKSFIELLQKHKLFHLILEKYEEKLPDINRIFVPNKFLKMEFKDEKEMEYSIYYSGAGLWNLLKHWVEAGTKESSEDMARWYERMN